MYLRNQTKCWITPRLPTVAFSSAAYTVHTPINPTDNITLNYLTYPTTKDYTATSFTCDYRKPNVNGSFNMYYIAVGS